MLVIKFCCLDLVSGFLHVNYFTDGKDLVRPDMRYCFRSGRFRPNPRTKHISVPPRHMTKSYIPDFNMISQHYRYKIQHLIQSAYNCLKYITTALLYVSKYRLQTDA